jgi:GNAT superfamily N-acetyltransferase
MISKSWLRFTRALSGIPEPEPSQIRPITIRPASPEEERDVIDVLAKSTSLDSSLGDAARLLQHYFTELAPRLWKNKERCSLAAFHGDRVIGASVYLTAADEVFHLASGPCVVSEYRNRGIGKALLQATLYDLQECGLSEVSGVCREHSVLAKYLYPKFGGVAERIDFTLAGAS